MEIKLFEQPTGKCEVKDFIEKECDGLDAAKVIQKLEDLEEHSFLTLLQTRRIEKIEEGLYEVRLRLNRVFYRFFGVPRNGVLYLAYAIKKKTNKLTKKDIKTARGKVSCM